MRHARLRRAGLLAAVLVVLASFVPGQTSQAQEQTAPVFTPSGRPASDEVATAGTRTMTVSKGGQSVETTVLQQERAPNGRAMRAGSLIVKFRPGTDAATRLAAHTGAGSLGIQRLQLADTLRIQVRPNTVEQSLAAYQARADVEFAEPDYIRRANLVPNDQGFPVQWGMARISAPAAWDRQRSASSVRIAVLDCGVYSSSSHGLASDGQTGHPDIRNKVIVERDFTGSTTGADDYCDHGTHVSGIAAASTNNGIGVAGVGFDASIMNGKVLGDDGSGSTSWVINGITWAADNGAKVINMSLGGPGACSVSEQAAVDYAWSHGAVVVAAAGNEAEPGASTPANCRNVIAVAATDPADRIAEFSNFGANVDVAAPGVDIISTNFNGNYEAFDGTSQASPHVAGLAALVWSSEYGTSNQAVVDRILSTADRIAGTGTLWAAGRINAAAALAASGPASGAGGSSPAPVPQPAPSPTPTPPPAACPGPRPPVQVAASLTAPGILGVTVSAGAGQLRELRFGAATNALIDVAGQAGRTGNFTVQLTGVQQAAFAVRQANPGGATTVPLVARDDCGDWQTLVGGGASAFSH